MNKKLAVLLLCLSTIQVRAACPSWPTAQRFVMNGAEVTDLRTRLVWARCSVGQSWNGSTCTGDVAVYSHQGALAYAQSKPGWRLPNVKELASIADKGCPPPAIDSVAFPATPISGNYYGWLGDDGFWSSSPNAASPSSAWAVSFYQGLVFTTGRDNLYMRVRLVRVAQ